MPTPIWPIEGVALDSTSDMVDDSLAYMVTALFEHATKTETVYPTLSNGIDVVSANADWTLGAFATIAAASEIGIDYHVIHITVEAVSDNAVFELVLYHGDGDTECGRIRFAAVGGFWGNARYRVDSTRIPADDRIRAKVASSNGTANQATVRISLGYLTH